MFWDADWEMADEYLNLPPEAASEQLDRHGIAEDYFTAVPDDLAGENLEDARQQLARLTGGPSPDRSGPYTASPSLLRCGGRMVLTIPQLASPLEDRPPGVPG